MKIGPQTSKTKDIGKKSTSTAGGKVTQTTATKFVNFMDKANEESFEDYLKNLAKNIFEQGEKLSQKIDVRELKIYKTLITEFLGNLLGNENRFSKNSKLDRRGRHKVYITINKINEELENITNDVLSSQSDNIKILKRIEDIRGLILDIDL
jgi:uncharacterized protein YaaR (DUF327 family)